MDNSTIVLLINDEARAVTAVYEEHGAPETFKTLDPTIEAGDLVVVESNTRHKMTVCRVEEVDVDVNFDTSSKVKWIVQKIEAERFAQIIEQEKEAIAAVQAAERRRKKDELRASLFKDHEAKIKTLSLANMDGDDPVTE